MKSLFLLPIFSLATLAISPSAFAAKINVCECSLIDCSPKSIFFRGCKALTNPIELEFIQIDRASEVEMEKKCNSMVTEIRWERHPRLSADQARRLAKEEALVSCQAVEF